MFVCLSSMLRRPIASRSVRCVAAWGTAPFYQDVSRSPLSASHATLQLAVALVESVRRPATIAGFPLSAWAFALRIWAAMMVALYAAFWLQLESASSAAVTVGILALQTRGQAYQKAVYRILGTIIGVVASLRSLDYSHRLATYS